MIQLTRWHGHSGSEYLSPSSLSPLSGCCKYHVIPPNYENNKLISNFCSAFGITSYTAGIAQISEQFDVSMTVAIVGYGIMFWGIAFAPTWVPHATEQVGRKPVYIAALVLFSICVIGVGFANNFSTVLAMRFFAGFFGGPIVVLIEGTFADTWSARTTVTYYSYLTLASYIGAACGKCSHMNSLSFVC